MTDPEQITPEALTAQRREDFRSSNLVADLQKRAGWLRKEYLNGGNFEHLSAREQECTYIAYGMVQPEIERLERERNAYRSLAGIGLTGTIEADELAALEPIERDREAFRRIQERSLATLKAGADAARPAVETTGEQK